MTKPEYLKELRKLNAKFIAANRRLQDAEIVTRYLPPQKFVVLEATGVNTTSNCEVSYKIQALNADGSLGLKSYIYGYEWENFKPTGEYYEFEDDIL